MLSVDSIHSHRANKEGSAGTLSPDDCAGWLHPGDKGKSNTVPNPYPRLARLLLWLLLAAPALLWAEDDPAQVGQSWLMLPDDWQPQRLDDAMLQSYSTSSSIDWNGGIDWHLLKVQSEQPIRQVIDFRNSSVIGRFNHWVLDGNGRTVAEFEGGIQSEASNPYLMRHGRLLELPPGDYQVITRLNSPFYLAEPEPQLFEPGHYQQSIKVGNAITLAGMGIFFALGIYYIVLGTSRGRVGDLFYAVFIWGNFFYNGAALMVFSDLLQIKEFYLISIPILISNPAYIAFVMVLLHINRHSSRTLTYIGNAIIALLITFWLVALLQPTWSLELDRYGVAMFAIYGLSAAITRLIQGNRTARYYLIANLAFFIPGLISIGVSTLNFADTLFIEHIGLFAVAIEVILLSLVISHQVGMVYREKEAGLLATQEALLAANRALDTKERFLANVSHELRTPLNAIQGSVELIDRYGLPTGVMRHIQAIQSSSNFLLYLINDILDLAKMNADQLTLMRTRFELDEALDELSGLYSNAFNRDRVRVYFDVAADVPLYLTGDVNRLKQVLANLLSNALKFTEQGEICLLIRRVDDNHLEFRITDTGIGIEAEKLQSVFSAFTQADASIARKYGGTGLGLQIAAKVVHLMGGHLGVDSQPGHGSEFYFVVPIEDAPAKTASREVPLALVHQGERLARLLTQDLDRYGLRPSALLTVTEALQGDLPDADAWVVIADHFNQALHQRLAARGRPVKWLLHQSDGSADDQLDIELLPYARANLPRLLEASPAERPPDQDHRLLAQLQVVAVDDNIVNLKVLIGMLHRLGVDCTGFERPDEAIRHIGSHYPDIVLMDVQMPIIDGLEATRHLRGQSFRNPIIAFTANASDYDLDNCREAGMNDVLVKPIKLDDLKRILLKWSDPPNSG